MKRKWIFLACLVLVGALGLYLHGAQEPVQAGRTLWVVTELSNSDGMNYQARLVQEWFAEAYPDVSLELEILPTDEPERSIRLRQLRTRIMSGNGPDVYLLPTGGELVSDEPFQDENIPVEPLFSDVTQAMATGIFLDLSAWYDADALMDPGALNQQIMDAGIWNGHRYVLPLRYDVPVIYTRPDLCRDYGIREGLLQQDFLTLARGLLPCEDGETTAIGLAFPEELEILGYTLDYQSGKPILSEEVTAEYLALCQTRNAVTGESLPAFFDYWEYYARQYRVLYGTYTDEMWEEWVGNQTWPTREDFCLELFNLLGQYTHSEYHWCTSGIPVYTGSLSGVLETLAVSKIAQVPVEVYPLRNANGQTQASIAYWGAVGVDCAEPDLAYAFLREFFREEYQWDILRPRVDKDVAYWEIKQDPQQRRMVEDSLPVRIHGSIAGLWDNLQYQVQLAYNSTSGSSKKRARTARLMEITEEEVPGLDWQFDVVSFPVTLDAEESLAYAMGQLNEADGTPTDVDLQALAANLKQSLWWHLAEG